MTEQERHDLLKDKPHKYLTPRSCFYKQSRGGNRRFWKCECVCGNFVEREEYTILRGLTESCGCKHPRNLKGKETTRYTGYEDINGQYISELKGKARDRQLKWDEEVTVKYLWELFIKQDKKCALTGLDLIFQGHRDKLKGLEQTASLDRIDSLKGYEIGNLQWVHKDVNKIKNNLSEERLFELCELIVQRRKLKSQENLF
jgi:hypothetical protein